MGRGAPAVECSFCGKAQSEVAKVIAGPGAVYICNECVDLCTEIIGAEIGGAPDIGKSEVRSLLLQAAHLLSGPSPDVAADLRAAAKRL